jgi:hypothetical protein
MAQVDIAKKWACSAFRRLFAFAFISSRVSAGLFSSLDLGLLLSESRSAVSGSSFSFSLSSFFSSSSWLSLLIDEDDGLLSAGGLPFQGGRADASFRLSSVFLPPSSHMLFVFCGGYSVHCHEDTRLPLVSRTKRCRPTQWW